jgi:hypothetical protein
LLELRELEPEELRRELLADGLLELLLEDLRELLLAFGLLELLAFGLLELLVEDLRELLAFGLLELLDDLRLELPLLDFVSPAWARCLFTVRAAISSAVPSLLPRFS